jgi:tetratricopeptide (TPR) repeat protein
MNNPSIDDNRNSLKEIEIFSKAIADAPNDIDIVILSFYYLSRGIYYIKTRQITLAIQDFNILIKLDPEHIDNTYRWRGYAYCFNGNYDAAIQDFSRVLDPNSDDAFNGRGICYALKGQYNQASQDFTQAILAATEPDPNPNPNLVGYVNIELYKYYYNRGVAYSKQGENNLAEIDFNKAKSLHSAQRRHD